MNYENIIYAKDSGIARIIINRPEKRNALNRATRVEMANALEDAKADVQVKVLILSGAGDKSFVAGSDLTELSTFTPLQMERFIGTLGQQLYTRFDELEKPTIAMINGLCLGAGLELAMACDIRIASTDAKFGQPEILLGIIPGGGGTQRLTRLVGVGMAKEMIYTGAVINADEAYRIGLINKIGPFEELEAVTMRMASKISKQSPLTLKWAKRSIALGQDVNLNAGLAYEAMVECLLFSSKDKTEGMQAFFEKRTPEFEGK
ncbi:MAG: crotonase [Deltaproteobacteria bacterium]|nr:crotonase [Deltaproteobacteria bacterium]